MENGQTSNQKILLLGSNVSTSNLPIKEVSLLKEGSLPAYGYNPGDFIELLAGNVRVEDGRLEQCRTWLSSCLSTLDESPDIQMEKYGIKKQVYQIFRKRKQSGGDDKSGWFMHHQILPAEGRGEETEIIKLGGKSDEKFSNNDGIIIIDDSGRPPAATSELVNNNEDAWVIGMGISTIYWKSWAEKYGEKFFLFCRLSDLETTRMEMDTSVIWESLVAMVIRAVKSNETGLWDESGQRFLCNIIVEMYPHGILAIGPGGIFFRQRPKSLPQKSSPRHKGAVPCYDTMVTSMLARDFICNDGSVFCKSYFWDFSQRVMANWKVLDSQGYSFDTMLEFPELDFSSSYSDGQACSTEDITPDPYFVVLPSSVEKLDPLVEMAACQKWNPEKKRALRSLFPSKSSYAETLKKEHGLPDGFLGVVIEVLHHLKEEVSWKKGFEDLRIFSVGNLRTTDPVEIEPVITLQNVMDSYVSRETFQRPLCVGVFGPPGSGKSFSVKEVARVIATKFDSNPFDFFEFNLTQFASPEEINSAIEPIRASVAKGKVPIVFWDEFDCRYDDNEFGYLRYFLPSMQDGVTYVHGTPYNIGRSIFVFAGGVKSCWDDMEALLHHKDMSIVQKSKVLKIPDFMSRLRVVIDIDGIDLPENLLSNSATDQQLNDLQRILMKRAFIIAHQMHTHWKKAARKTSGLLLRLLLADYKFGARSIEAVIEASGASDRLVYGLPELIAPSAARIHAVWRIGMEREVDQIRKQQGVRAVW